MSGNSAAQTGHIATILDADRSVWDGLAGPDGFYVSHAWLRLIEEDQKARTEYIVAHTGDRLVGALPLYSIPNETNHLYHPDHYRELLQIDGEYLVAGSRLGYHSTLLLDSAFLETRSGGVLQSMLGYAIEHAAQAGFKGLILPFLTTSALRQLCEVVPATVALESVEANLMSCPGGVQGYLARSRSRLRSKARRDLEDFAAAGWQVREQRLSSCAMEFATLFGNVQSKYGRPIPRDVLEWYLGRQAAILDDLSVLFACGDERGAVAMVLMYRWGDTLFSRLVGMDYPRLRGGEYFNLVYYLPLDYMDAMGLNRLHLGIGAWQTKALRGSVMRPLWTACVTAVGPGPSLNLRKAEAIEQWRADLARFGDARTVADDWLLA
jgi:hypothetical protein